MWCACISTPTIPHDWHLAPSLLITCLAHRAYSPRRGFLPPVQFGWFSPEFLNPATSAHFFEQNLRFENVLIASVFLGENFSPQWVQIFSLSESVHLGCAVPTLFVEFHKPWHLREQNLAVSSLAGMTVNAVPHCSHILSIGINSLYHKRTNLSSRRNIRNDIGQVFFHHACGDTHASAVSSRRSHVALRAYLGSQSLWANDDVKRV
jgi:hypothetical protein